MTEQAAPAAVTVRYWAGARQAAGVSEEPVDAATVAELLDAVRGRHGAAFARVLSVCSFVVGDQPLGRRDPAAVPLHDGDVVEVLPPFAGGSADVVLPEVGAASRGVVAGLAVLAGVLLAVAAWASGEAAVWLVAVLLQVPLVTGWHRGLGVTAPTGGAVVGAVVALAADLGVWLVDDASMAPLAVVVGVTFLLGAVQQLARRDDRVGVTAGFAATTTLGFLVACLAVWPVATRLAEGAPLVAVAALAVASASLARAVPALPAAAVLAPVLGLAGGLAAALLVGGLTWAEGAVVGVVVALPVLLADLLERRDPRLTLPPRAGSTHAAAAGRRRVVVVAAVWPYALAAPLAFLTAGILTIGS